MITENDTQRLAEDRAQDESASASALATRLAASLSTEVIRFAMVLAGRTASGAGVQSITLAKPLYRRLEAEIDARESSRYSPPALRATERGPFRIEICTPVGPVIILEGE
jgi:hypothetical protein